MINHKTVFRLFFLLLPTLSYSQDKKIDSAGIRWNRLPPQDTAYIFNNDPNNLLIETATELSPGKALDLGMEYGRNSIYLAMNGWDVTGVDIADEALAFAINQTAENKLNIDAHVTPMAFDFGINEWNLIVHVYKGCLDNFRISKIAKALKPGGVLVFEFFHRDAGIEMKRPTFGCETNSVKKTIEQAGEFRILRYSEAIGIADNDLKNYKLVKLVAARK